MAEHNAAAGATTPLRPHETRRRTMQGKVVSNKMQKTVVVAVESVRQHPIYKRNIRRTRRFKAHDEENRCQVGDVVIIAESRPISKEKHWIVRQIVKETIGPGLEVLLEEPNVTAAAHPASVAAEDVAASEVVASSAATSSADMSGASSDDEEEQP